ncbi:MAG TPA: anti-phage dCTP deaminase [Rhizomicrobium sp.]|jgi:cytidine deaminase|nr:anti-phage dCTP deaminase [Rhizomicrobium sp.]
MAKKPETKLPQAIAPELIFGLVAPIGVDLDLVSSLLSEALSEMNYGTHVLRLTRLMREINMKLPLDAQTYIALFKEKIAYANAIREKFGDEALAALAISAIRAYRGEANKRADTTLASPSAAPLEERPLSHQAYILRQFKRPEEIALLRSVYGKQFILVSAYAPEQTRLRRTEAAERKSRGGVISSVDAHKSAFELIAQDAMEDADVHGQNVRDAFPLGDVFIDTSTKTDCERTIRRFVRVLFGSNEITPTRDEYGMYMAKSASLRSSDLSRQIGAAICRDTGEVVTLGCNEVPKAGGGTYWPGDVGDGRDFVRGFDANDRHKLEVLSDLISRLKEGGYLGSKIGNLDSPEAISQMLLRDETARGIAASRLMDIIEFGRIIHAEMSAICDAARLGVPVRGGTLLTTTFPCHLCAKHIVAAGIKRVVFLEPYPKSYASELHDDSITVGTAIPGKVLFEPFIGISPYRYRDLFQKGKRKVSGGAAQQWHKDQKRPMIEVYYPSYFEAEAFVVDELHQKMKQHEASIARK